MPTVDLLLPPRAYSRWTPAAGRPIHPAAMTWRLICGWIDRARKREVLAGLNDHLLRDIGITRLDAARESRKWFWQ